jgi:hypothetical protein
MSEPFVVTTAPPIWKGYPSLARACELSRLTLIQADAVRLAKSGLTIEQIGRALPLRDPAASYDVCRYAGRKLRARYRFRDHGERYWREVVTCFRNRKESGGSPVTLTGIMTSRLPWVEEPDIGPSRT